MKDITSLKLDRPMNSYACLQKAANVSEDPDCTVKLRLVQVMITPWMRENWFNDT